MRVDDFTTTGLRDLAEDHLGKPACRQHPRGTVALPGLPAETSRAAHGVGRRIPMLERLSVRRRRERMDAECCRTDGF